MNTATRAARHLALPALCALHAGAFAETALPVRTESVLGAGDLLRIAGSLLLLLGVTVAVLWFWQRRYGRLPPGFSRRDPPLEVVARLRLSPRTQVFVIRRHGHEYLVTESGNGPAHTLALPEPPPAAADAADTAPAPQDTRP